MRADLGIAIVLATALATAGCARRADGPVPIATGTPCAVCGMSVQDLRYACEDLSAGRFRIYDSIECLLKAAPPGERAWLADWDSCALVARDSMWIVHGDLPSPMGGGYAAFRDRAAADEVATARHGLVTRGSAPGVPANAMDGGPR